MVKKSLSLVAALLLASVLAPYLVGQETGRTSLVQYAPGSLGVIPKGGFLLGSVVTYKLYGPSRRELAAHRSGVDFAGIEPGIYTVLVEGSTSRGVGTASVAPNQETVVHVEMLRIRAHTQMARITVREAITREPFPEVKVVIDGVGDAVTDSEGGATFSSIPCGTRQRVRLLRGQEVVGMQLIEVGNDTTASYEMMLQASAGIAVTAGLQAWYPMNASSPTMDAGPYSRNADRETNVPLPAEDRHGVAGGALHFDGKASAVTIPDAGWQKEVPLSVSFWVRTNAATDATGTAMFMGKYLHPTGAGWLVFYEKGLLCAAHISNGFAVFSRVNTQTSIDEKWHHIVITITPTTLTM